jgi:hypothetical protein
MPQWRISIEAYPQTYVPLEDVEGSEEAVRDYADKIIGRTKVEPLEAIPADETESETITIKKRKK